MKLNWKEIAVTGLIAIVAVVFIWPLARPFVAKVPFVGKYV